MKPHNVWVRAAGECYVIGIIYWPRPGVLEIGFGRWFYRWFL